MTPSAGLSFKLEHLREAITCPAELWFEVHPENYMVDGGPRLAALEALREARPLSMHGVGLSLASAADPCPTHLSALKRLVDRFEPFLVSEHLAWSRQGERHFPDLLPIPRSQEALERLQRNIDITQNVLVRPILIENPSHYLAIEGHDWGEGDFLGELARRTGCGLLLDISNVAVSAHNLGFDAGAWLDAFPAEHVGEIHLAGHSADAMLDLLIDSHDRPVNAKVWALYERFIARAGPKPTLIEWDAALPAFEVLRAEADRAAALLSASRVEPCHA